MAKEIGHLEIVDLVKIFESRNEQAVAVDHIDLDIQPGQFLTLLGPSGCGKTTTLRMIAGFETATNGKILLDGRDMSDLPPNQRPMTMVFQSYALFPHMSVAENVAYGLRIKKMPKDQIKPAVEAQLKVMDLEHLKNRSPRELSGGQQQRVALARALVMKPNVLLFDEPLSNLDAKLRVQMRLEIRRIQRELQITSVYVTHDQMEAMSMSDRVIIMNKGKIAQIGTPYEIYLHPESVFVADFIGRANFLKVASVPSINGSSAKVELFGQAYEVKTTPQAENAAERVLLVRPEAVSITASSQRQIGGTVGRVQVSVFYGDNVEYEIETSEGCVVAVHSNPATEQIFQEGDFVNVAFDTSKALLLGK